ncbi:hypothetical protein IAR55_005138 [Kwoniella newhampshirensis]|uniref:RING-type domain-containing protein n=1 Tax=Kwoniella newhampshirensis TaxID=1651941 RepID=A0AAW0YX89_9TREE
MFIPCRFAVLTLATLTLTVTSIVLPHSPPSQDVDLIEDRYNRSITPSLNQLVFYDGFATRQYEYGQVPRTSAEQGWLSRWLAMGGEGNVVVHIDDGPTSTSPPNISLPHRPAAFPSHLSIPLLPLSGFLAPFHTLPAPSTPTPAPAPPNDKACLPPLSPLNRRGRPPSPPYTIALLERGGCDFATKVRAAQDRGAAGVIVGDGQARVGESEEEGKRRESLITMFSPEDTDEIFIPSVFVSRASYLFLRDLLANGTDSGRPEGPGIWIDIGQGSDEGGALTSLLSFALLMPSLFLLATIAIHRFRVARQREADRAPPLVVLSLPERIWTPDIVWEKDDSSSDRSVVLSPIISAIDGSTSPHANIANGLPPPPPISPDEVRTPPAITIDVPDPLFAPPSSHIPTAASGPSKRKERVKRQYFSKDECAICMDSFAKGDVVRILPCGHVFHKDECDEWLLKWRKLCPTCRADVTLPPGANLKGSKITPVSVPADPNIDEEEGTHNDDEGSLLSNWGALWRSARLRLLRREGGALRLEDGEGAEPGERTPLVSRTQGGGSV